MKAPTSSINEHWLFPHGAQSSNWGKLLGSPGVEGDDGWALGWRVVATDVAAVVTGVNTDTNVGVDWTTVGILESEVRGDGVGCSVSEAEGDQIGGIVNDAEGDEMSGIVDDVEGDAVQVDCEEEYVVARVELLVDVPPVGVSRGWEEL